MLYLYCAYMISFIAAILFINWCYFFLLNYNMCPFFPGFYVWLGKRPFTVVAKMRRPSHYDSGVNQMVAAQMQHAQAQRLQHNSGMGHYPGRADSLQVDEENQYLSSKAEGKWQWDRDGPKGSNVMSSHMYKEGKFWFWFDHENSLCITFPSWAQLIYISLGALFYSYSFSCPIYFLRLLRSLKLLTVISLILFISFPLTYLWKVHESV